MEGWPLAYAIKDFGAALYKHIKDDKAKVIAASLEEDFEAK